MVEQILFLIGRILFGGFLAFMGVNHFLDLDNMAQYAKFKGVPFPRLAVIASGLLLLVGGLSIIFGLFPLIGVIALSIFFLTVTPLMHNFWELEGEQQQTEMVQFLKNMIILGAVLVFAYTLQFDWPLAA